MTSALFKPIEIGTLTVRNRIGMPALTRNRAPNTIPGDIMVEYYTQRAKGNVGLIVSEGTLVSRQGTEWPHAPGLWNKEQVAGWKRVIDAVHAEGTYIYAQLWHVGRAAHPDAEEQKLAGIPVYAPSAVAARGGKFRTIPGVPGYVTPTAVEDPWILIEQYRTASLNAKEAGFDGIELHGANGYLVHQFLDSTINFRTDKWGGSIENRCRFGLEVLKVMIEVFGPNVSLKVGPTGGYNDVGMPLQENIDTFNYFISEADKLKLSYITLVRYVAATDVVIDGKLRSTIHDVLETYGPLIKNAKVFINGDVSPEEGAQLIESGKADAVFFGFAWITHPDMAKRVAHGKPLNNIPDIPHLQWGKTEKEQSIGYTDYPVAVY